MKFTRKIETNMGISLPAAAVKPRTGKVNTDSGRFSLELGVYADSKSADDSNCQSVGGAIFPTRVEIGGEDFEKVVLPAWENFLNAVKDVIGLDLSRQCAKMAKKDPLKASAKDISWTK
jgi:hypothetical protein